MDDHASKIDCKQYSVAVGTILVGMAVWAFIDGSRAGRVASNWFFISPHIRLL